MQDPDRHQHFHLQVKTELEALAKVLQWFEQVAAPLLYDQTYWQCQISLAEGFTNAVRHAHGHLSPTTLVNIEVIFGDRTVEIKIWDWGKPFDLQAKLGELENSDEDPLEREGGRGLLFMRQLMDELNYIRVCDDRNCLVMRKKC